MNSADSGVNTDKPNKPLAGIRVLELGQLLADDPGLASNAGRVKREAELDDVLALLAKQRVPGGPIYNDTDHGE